MEWQRIETAPKNCDVLLYCPRRGVVRGKWDDCRYARIPKPYWTNDREHLFGMRETRAYQPTHWMPLPAPPSNAEARDAAQGPVDVSQRTCRECANAEWERTPTGRIKNTHRGRCLNVGALLDYYKNQKPAPCISISGPYRVSIWPEYDATNCPMWANAEVSGRPHHETEKE